MFGDHLWEGIKKKMEAKGQQVIKKVDDQ